MKNESIIKIEQQIEKLLTRTHLGRKSKKNEPFPLTADAWHIVGIAPFDSPSVQTSLLRLQTYAKPGKFSAILELSAQLGEAELNDPSYACNPCRPDVEKSIASVRSYARRKDIATI